MAANANAMPNIAAQNEQARQIDDDDPNIMVQWAVEGQLSARERSQGTSSCI